MKTKLTAVSLLTAASLMLGGCSQSEAVNRFESYDFSAKSETVVYNENPDLSGKKDTGISSQGDYIKMDFEDYVRSSDSVIIGRALDDGTEKLYGEDGVFCEPSSDTASSDGLYPFSVTLVQMKVEKVICGELKEDTITFFEMGKPQSDNVNIKVKKGEEYLILLQDLGDGIYKSGFGDRSVFQIKDDFSVYSFSSDIRSARYDGLPLADLVYDVETAFNTPTNRFESYDFSARSENIVYNENPDNSAKPTLGTPVIGDRIFFDTLGEQINAFADCAAVVTVLDGGTQTVCCDDGTYKDYDGENLDLGVCTPAVLTKAKIQYVIGGEIAESEITIMQTGYVGKNDSSVKLEKGADYVLLLEDFIDGTYKISCAEESMFKIGADMTVTSLTEQEYCARYDGLSLADLVYDVETALLSREPSTIH